MRKKIVGAVLVMVAVAGVAVRVWTPATFTVTNESGQFIASMTVEVAGKLFRFENVPTGGEVSGSFYVDHEECLDLRGHLADGTKFRDYCGYVVWEEFAPHIHAVVRSDGQVDSQSP